MAFNDINKQLKGAGSREQKIEELSSTLLRRGLAMTKASARQLAESMVATEEKVQRKFEEQRMDRRPVGDYVELKADHFPHEDATQQAAIPPAQQPPSEPMPPPQSSPVQQPSSAPQTSTPPQPQQSPNAPTPPQGPPAPLMEAQQPPPASTPEPVSAPAADEPAQPTGRHNDSEIDWSSELDDVPPPPGEASGETQATEDQAQPTMPVEEPAPAAAVEPSTLAQDSSLDLSPPPEPQDLAMEEKELERQLPAYEAKDTKKEKVDLSEVFDVNKGK